MKKSEVIKRVAAQTGVSQVDVRKVIQNLGFLAEQTVQARGQLPLGWLTIKTVERAARTCRNPRTGEQIPKPASTAPKFVPSITLKNAASAARGGA